MPSEDELRHNYLKRTEEDRQAADFGRKARHPLAGMAEVFYDGNFSLFRQTAYDQLDKAATREENR